MEMIYNPPLYSVQPLPVQVAPVPQFTPTGTAITTLTIASAVTIGSNMVDVQNGSMTIPQAVMNGVVKGTAATLILDSTARKTALQVALAAGILAGAGYLIDSAMKNKSQQLCTIEESPVK